MKICAIICEFNPFHNGHAYLIERAKAETGADAIVCFMSGNFVQRGDAAIIDKYTRAKHAILGGADAVIELPAVFATSPAELFAKGGIKLAAALPDVAYLAFGCESGNAENFAHAAKLLSDEPPEISNKIKAALSEGQSFARAREEAWKGEFDEGFLSSPNNILGIEYAKAIAAFRPDIRLCPVKRVGSGYLDEALSENFSSATAIRAAILRGDRASAGKNIPPYVEKDLPKPFDELPRLEKLAILQRTDDELKNICDCREGLEHALKNAVERGEEDIPAALTSKRYTTSRIRRIMLQNLLDIEETFIRDCLDSPLYLKLLAAKKERVDLLKALSGSPYPLLTKTKEEEGLQGTAADCLKKEKFADGVFALARNATTNKKRFL